jgi:hypothetical protein
VKKILTLALLSIVISGCGGGGGGVSSSGGGDGGGGGGAVPAGPDINDPPHADAGSNQIVAKGSSVILNGEQSLDPEGEELSYAWSLVSAPDSSVSSLLDFSVATPSITPDVSGDYVIELVVNDGTQDSTPSQITISAYTGVSGIYLEDALWSSVNSPYVVTDDVQIAFGTTLTIEGGVKVFGNDLKLSIFGTLKAVGTAENKINIENLYIDHGDNDSNEPSYIEIRHAEFIAGRILGTGNSVYGSFDISDSVLSNTNDMYISYPVEDSTIERNIFVDSGGISVGIRAANVVVRNNVFIGSTGSGPIESTYAVRSSAAYGNSSLLVEYNSFLTSNQIAVELGPGVYDTVAMIAENNFWNTVNQDEIETMIYDKNDDLGLAGFISYSPYLTEPHPDTPDASAYID